MYGTNDWACGEKNQGASPALTAERVNSEQSSASITGELGFWDTVGPPNPDKLGSTAKWFDRRLSTGSGARDRAVQMGILFVCSIDRRYASCKS